MDTVKNITCDASGLTDEEFKRKCYDLKDGDGGDPAYFNARKALAGLDKSAFEKTYWLLLGVQGQVWRVFPRRPPLMPQRG